MVSLTTVLEADDAIDLQMHTIFSDGQWTPAQLIDYLVQEQFGLAAITDHERVDTVVELQRLAGERRFPLLVAAEMSTSWNGEMTDVLCFGFDPVKHVLRDLAQDVMKRQSENTREICENLRKRGVSVSPQDLDVILTRPSAQQPHELVAVLKKQGHEDVGTMIMEVGFSWATSDIAAVVDATHQCGGVCLIAHPGRGEGYTVFDVPLLDELRRQVPIDGFEAYYPAHSQGQIHMYCEYAQAHHLLTSAGSDSHGPEKKPIKYRADVSRNLLERLGVQVR